MMTILGPLVLDLHLQESAFQSSPSSIIGVNALSARKASLLLKRHSSTSMTYLSALNLQVHFYLWLRGGCSLLRTCFRPELIYAMRKAGRIVTESNQHLLTDEELQEWQDAIGEYLALVDKQQGRKQ